MSVCLTKKQAISLTKVNNKLENLYVGLGWDMATKGSHIDCDAVAVPLMNGKLHGVFGNVVCWTNLVFKDNSIVHGGDNLTGKGDGDDEVIRVYLSKLKKLGYDGVAFGVNVFSGQTFDEIKNAFIRLVNDDTKEEICRYNLTDGYAGCRHMVLGELHLVNDEWIFTAVGEGGEKVGIKHIKNRYK